MPGKSSIGFHPTEQTPFLLDNYSTVTTITTVITVTTANTVSTVTTFTSGTYITYVCLLKSVGVCLMATFEQT